MGEKLQKSLCMATTSTKPDVKIPKTQSIVLWSLYFSIHTFIRYHFNHSNSIRLGCSNTLAIEGFLKAEKPLAVFNFILTVTTIVWISTGHLSFLPGWDALWGDLDAQYPRRGEGGSHDALWTYIYIGMSGILGAIGQYVGLAIGLGANRSTTTTITISRPRRLGFFHVVIDLHYIKWSLRRDWERSDFENTDIVLGGYLPFGILASITGYHGLKLLLCNAQTAKFQEIVRRKTLVDASSFMSLIEFFSLVENWMGVRNIRGADGLVIDSGVAYDHVYYGLFE